MAPTKRTLVLVSIGLLLLPGPAYVVAYDTVTPDRSSTGYVASELDRNSSSFSSDRVVKYENLTANQQHTFDTILAASDAPDTDAYYPRRDEPVLTDSVIEKRGSYYRVYGATHSQDVSIGAFFLGLVSSLVGLSILAYAAWRARDGFLDWITNATV